jgi:hypothetical protein
MFAELYFTKYALVNQYPSLFRVEFSTNIKWMSIEFSPQCGTSQAEDYLKLSIPKEISTHNRQNNRNPKISIEHEQIGSVDKKLNLCLVKKFNT